MTYIFISASKDDLDYARHVRTLLELNGYSTWIDERTEFVMPANVQHVMETLIEAAGVVVAIEGGDPDDLETAQRFGKPIFYLGRKDDPAALIPEIAFALPDVVSPTRSPLPEPLDAARVRAMQEEFVREQRISTRTLVTGGVVVAATVLFVIIWLGSGLVNPLLVTPSATESALVETVTTATMATSVPTTVAQVNDVTELAPTQLLATNTPSRTPTRTMTATPTPEGTATARASVTPTMRPSATASPVPSVTSTSAPPLTPDVQVSATVMLPSLSSTLLPAGTSNTAWIPIERLVRGVVVVYVPGGCFNLNGEEDDDGDGMRCVQPFWISKTEVTNAQYAVCVRARSCTAPTQGDSRTRQLYYNNPDYADYPVINIMWSQAQDFSRWFGGSLPTETQWRYAAAGPSAWQYPWGSDVPNADLLNYDGTYGDVTRTGAFPAGASWVGALDMAGNVWEWTSTISNQSNRVVRGGSWNSYEGLVSADSRAENAPSDSNAYTGFRIVVDATTLR